MIKDKRESAKFLEKLANEPGALRVRLTPDGILRFEGSHPFEVSDFIAVHEGKAYARSGMTWFPFAPLPENAIDLCAFSIKRFALMKGEGMVDISSEKKPLDDTSAFLLCAKLPGKYLLIVADGAVCSEVLRIFPVRDHFGVLLATTVVKEFVRKVLPDQLPVLEMSLDGGTSND